MTMNRYDNQASFLPAIADARRATIDVGRVADVALAVTASAEADSSALAAMRTVSETSTPVQRGYGIAIKVGVSTLVASLATLALWLAGATGWQVAAFFIIWVVIVLGWLFYLDYTHSPIGGERHKASLYAHVQKHRIDSDERVQLAKVDAFLALARMNYGQDDDTPGA